MNTGLRNGTDQYTYWSVPRSVYVTLTVLNNGVDVAFGNTTGAGGAESANYPPNDEYLTPGALIRPDNFDAVRIRNHVAGAIAQYSISTRLAEDVPSDVPLGASFTPTYLSVDAQGNISANFTGHVDASELDLVAAPANPSPIKWLADSQTGAMVAQLTGNDTGDLTLQARSLTLETTGGTPATFTGVINAQGLGLPASSASDQQPTAVNSVQWTRQSDGAVIANVGAGNPVGAFSSLFGGWAYNPDSDTRVVTAEIGASATPYGTARSLYALIECEAQGGGVGQIVGIVSDPVNGASSIPIFTSAGGSGFLQTSNALGEVSGASQATARTNLGFSYPFSIYPTASVSPTASMQAPFNAIDVDPGNYRTTINGYYCFQAPADGWYLVCGQVSILTSANSTALASIIQPGINVNTFTNLRLGTQLYTTTTGGAYNLPIATVIHLVANQPITLALSFGALNTTTFAGGSTKTYMQVIRVY